MKDSLISVIVPVYNTEQYLRCCIDSICNQTHENLEIILVDDGSPDNCPAICDEYAAKDDRVKVIHKPNGGVSSARNAGLDIATGDYIGFVDSDDFIVQDMYAKMLAALMKHNAGICLCRSVVYNQSGEYGACSTSAGPDDVVLSSLEIQKELVNDGSPKYVIVCNKLISKSIFSELRFIEGKQHEDEQIAHQLYELCNTAVLIDDVLYTYRIRDNSIMHETVSPKRLDAVDALIDRCFFYINKKYYDLAIKTLVSAVKSLTSLSIMLKTESSTLLRINQLRHELCKLKKRLRIKPVQNIKSGLFILDLFPLYVPIIKKLYEFRKK